MRYETKVTVYLHSDIAPVPRGFRACDCGDREWLVQLPSGWMWRDHAGPGPFDRLEDAATYAKRLYPNHPDITRCDPSVPDLWDYPNPVPNEPEEANQDA
jgi:hypothetical protein